MPCMGADELRRGRNPRLLLRAAAQRGARMPAEAARGDHDRLSRLGRASRPRSRARSFRFRRGQRHRAHERRRDRVRARTACRTPSCQAAIFCFSRSPQRSASGAAFAIWSAACARPITPGYPDCRNETLSALNHAINLGTGERFTIITPLMWRTKAETWALTHALGGQSLVDIVAEYTHTCYKGDREHRHEWGYGCDACPACNLREKGYRAWRCGAEAPA